MNVRQKLQEYDREITRWEKFSYRDKKGKQEKVKSKPKKAIMLYVDTLIFKRMMRKVSPSAHVIAHEVIYACSYGTNYYDATYEEIEKECDLGRGSVIRAMKELQGVDFIRKVRNGRWMLNPAIGTKCEKQDEDKLRDTFFSLKAHVSESTESKGVDPI